MIITAITKQNNSSNRYNVYVDYDYCFSADYGDIIKLGLKENSVLDSSSLKSVIHSCQYQKAFNKALKILTLRSKSEHDLRKKLLTMNYDNKIIDEIFIRLKELNYINDTQYVKLWIEERKRSKPSGKRRIIEELNCKGINPQDINEAIGEFEFDDFKTAIDILKKKSKVLKSKNSLNDIKERNKLYKYLIYRGIDYDTACKAMNEFFNSNSDS